MREDDQPVVLERPNTPSPVEGSGAQERPRRVIASDKITLISIIESNHSKSNDEHKEHREIWGQKWGDSIKRRCNDLRFPGGGESEYRLLKEDLSLFMYSNYGWSKSRLTEIGQAKEKKSPLTVLELFELSEVLGVPPMRVIGEMTDDEERLLSYWHAMSDSQRDALLKLLGEFLPTSQNDDS